MCQLGRSGSALKTTMTCCDDQRSQYDDNNTSNLAATYNHLCYSTTALAWPHIASCHTSPSTMPYMAGQNTQLSTTWYHAYRHTTYDLRACIGPPGLDSLEERRRSLMRLRHGGRQRSPVMVELEDETMDGMNATGMATCYEYTCLRRYPSSVKIMIIKCATNTATFLLCCVPYISSNHSEYLPPGCICGHDKSN